MVKQQMVFHPERGVERGVIVRDERRKAWTPELPTATAPNEGMVRVRWSDSFDPTALFWEYQDQLTSTPATAGVR